MLCFNWLAAGGKNFLSKCCWKWPLPAKSEIRIECAYAYVGVKRGLRVNVLLALYLRTPCQVVICVMVGQGCVCVLWVYICVYKYIEWIQCGVLLLGIFEGMLLPLQTWVQFLIHTWHIPTSWKCVMHFYCTTMYLCTVFVNICFPCCLTVGV